MLNPSEIVSYHQSLNLRLRIFHQTVEYTLLIQGIVIPCSRKDIRLDDMLMFKFKR